MIGRMIRRVHMPEYNPSLLGGLLLGRRFFRSVTVSDSCLHDLLPQRRDSEILSRLRRHTVCPIPRTKTNNNIHYALAKYQ